MHTNYLCIYMKSMYTIILSSHLLYVSCCTRTKLSSCHTLADKSISSSQRRSAVTPLYIDFIISIDVSGLGVVIYSRNIGRVAKGERIRAIVIQWWRVVECSPTIEHNTFRVKVVIRAACNRKWPLFRWWQLPSCCFDPNSYGWKTGDYLTLVEGKSTA